MTTNTNKREWIEAGRARARAAFERLPLPSRSDELFKHTGLSDVNLELAAGAALAATDLPAECAALEEDEAALLTVANGKVLVAKTNGDRLGAASAALTALSGALPEFSADALAWMAKADRAPGDKFAALAESRAAEGAVFRIAAGKKLEGDARAAYFAPGGSSSYFRTLVVVEKGAEAAFVEDLSGSAGQAFAAGVADIWVGEGARLEYVSLQNFGAETDYFLRRRVHLAKGASVKYFALGIGGRKGQESLDVELAGEGAEFIAMGAAQGGGQQHLDFVANYRHSASHTKSGLDHWAVMSGEAKGVFNGLVHVEQTALHTDAYQKSRSLLLSKKASVHAMPKLIIATDEVACAHGASVSRIDADHLFYLMSRGIDEAEATKIIVSGFTGPVVNALPSKSMQERFRALLERKVDAES